jgi:microcin C transport system permease protein
VLVYCVIRRCESSIHDPHADFFELSSGCAQMSAYILRRLLLIIPTLFAIMVINFIVVQAAPGGPVEQVIAQLQGHSVDATARITGASNETGADQGRASAAMNTGQSRYRGAQGLDPELIADLEKLYGFDKPAPERFVKMMSSYVRFDFGDSFFRDRKVIDLVLDKMPVSISLGLWTTLLVYLISIPLGIHKAVRDGSSFDVWTSAVIIIGNAIPGFLFAVLLVVLFAGGSFLDWFPLRGLVSEGFSTLPWHLQIADYFWHLVLPIVAMTIGGFASLSMLTKNSFLDEINKQYVVTARAKGNSDHAILYGHIFRNAMLIIVAGFPSAFIGILFTSSLIIEVIFSLDGLGLLGFQAAIGRDYPVMFGTLYFSALLGLLLGLIGDLMYVIIDPRIDFDRRDT